MKSVIVKNLQIQFDLQGDKVTKANVIEALELLNTHLQGDKVTKANVIEALELMNTHLQGLQDF